MSKQKTDDLAAKQALIEEIIRRREEWLTDDLFVNGEPLTPELRRELGYPATAEEALARMRAAQKEQRSSKRKTA